MNNLGLVVVTCADRLRCSLSRWCVTPPATVYRNLANSDTLDAYIDAVEFTFGTDDDYIQIAKELSHDTAWVRPYPVMGKTDRKTLCFWHEKGTVTFSGGRNLNIAPALVGWTATPIPLRATGKFLIE